jgi:hypothetical protein
VIGWGEIDDPVAEAPYRGGDVGETVARSSVSPGKPSAARALAASVISSAVEKAVFRSYLNLPRFRVCVKNVEANALSLVAGPVLVVHVATRQNVLVSGVRAVHVAPEQHVWMHRHNQTGIIWAARREDDLGYLQQ